MIAELLRAIGQIIRINADAVSAHKSRTEIQEIPLRSRSFQNRLGINSHLMENNGQLIHKRNVDITLAVLNHLGCLRHLNGLSPVYSGIHNQLIHLCNGIQCLFVHTGYNLPDGIQAVHLVARIDSLRRITDLPVNAALKSRFLLNDRHAGLLCNSRIYG